MDTLPQERVVADAVIALGVVCSSSDNDAKICLLRMVDKQGHMCSVKSLPQMVKKAYEASKLLCRYCDEEVLLHQEEDMIE